MSGEIKVTPERLRQLASDLQHTAYGLSETHKRISQQLLNLPFQVAGKDALLNQAMDAGSKLITATDDFKKQSESLRKAADRFEKADNEEVSFGEGLIDLNLLAPFGGDISDWKDNPTGSALTLLGTLTGGAAAYKLAYLHKKGFRVTRYTDKKGKQMVRFQGRTELKDKNGFNMIRRTKLPLDEAKKIDIVKKYLLSPKELVKDSLKLKTNALGYASVAWDVIKDTKENIENKASASKFAGDIIGDAAVGMGSTAISVWGGAAIGTAFGGPVGAVAGAAIGFGISIGLSVLTDGVKFNKGDWNHDGKQDSIKDRVKSGIGFALDKIF